MSLYQYIYSMSKENNPKSAPATTVTITTAAPATITTTTASVSSSTSSSISFSTSSSSSFTPAGPTDQDARETLRPEPYEPDNYNSLRRDGIAQNLSPKLENPRGGHIIAAQAACSATRGLAAARQLECT